MDRPVARHQAAATRTLAWLLFLVGVAFIIATLEPAYRLSSFLRARGFLALTVGWLSTAIALLLLHLLVSGARITRLRVYLRSLPALVAFLAAAALLTASPAERFHFIEYGVLYLLALQAVSLDRNDLLAYPLALLPTVAAGVFDEFMQELSTVRHFDIADIRLNAVSALLAALLFASLFGQKPRLARFDASAAAHGTTPPNDPSP